jgi:tetratricopeptide (TPR) repeat protein
VSEILDLYKTGIARFPQSLVLRFNLIRAALHSGQPQDVSEALQMAEKALLAPASSWQLDVGEDVFPYDFESDFFNYRKYLDLVTGHLMQGAPVTADLIRLISASIYYYLGLYTQNPDHLKEALTLDPDFPFFKLEYARQMIRRGGPGDYQEAGALLTQLVEGSSLFVEAFEMLRQLQTHGFCRSQRFGEMARFVQRARHSMVTLPT